MTAPLDASLDQYGLPWWIGGWINPGDPDVRVALRALLDGVTVSHLVADAPLDDEGRRPFRLHFEEALDPGVIAAGRLRVMVLIGERPAAAIAPWEILTGVDAIAGAMATITRWRDIVGHDLPAVTADFPRKFPHQVAPLFPRARPLLTEDPLNDPRAVERDGASSLRFPVGLASTTGDAVLGRDGFVFLVRGTNALFDQYRVPPGSPATLARCEAWMAVLARRSIAAQTRGLPLVQTIIPEKSSVLPDYLPPAFAVTTPTPLLAALETRLNASMLALRHVSALDHLQSQESRTDQMRRLDTHLTPRGAFGLGRALVTSLGLPPPADLAFTRIAYPEADLQDRFFDVTLLDPVLEATLPDPPAELVEQVVPRRDKHHGRRQVWRRPDAPFKRRVVVFGNSFFNFADHGQCFLSHWFAHWFTEFHFVWSAECDWDYVDAVRADIVVCQTVERFLDVVPAA